MLVSELFTALALGELSNLSLVDEENGSILPKHQKKIIKQADDALLRLHSKFVLKEKNVFIQPVDYITFYRLEPKYSINYVPVGSEPLEPQRYILDTPTDRFTGDVIKILSVHDEHGHRFALNDEEIQLSLFTPQPTVLQLPNPDHADILSVLYQARHPKLKGDLSEIIEIPDVLESAFRAYIAYRVFSQMNTENSSAKSQEHYQVFEALCTEAVEKDLVNSSTSTSNTRFHCRGWI